MAAKLIGRNPDELKGLFEGVDESKTSDVYADAVAGNFSSLRDRIVKDKYNQGIREKAEAIESELKPLFEKYEIMDFDTAEKGIRLLAEKMEQDGTKTLDLSKLTPEQLKELPIVTKLQSQVTNLTDALATKESEFTDYKSGQEQERINSAALAYTTSFFDNENAVKGNGSYSDAAKMYLKTLQPGMIGLADDGKTPIVLENGQPKTNDFGQVVTFDDHIRDTYAYGFNVADPNKGGSGAGSGKRGGSGGSGITITSKEQGEKLIKIAHENGDKEGLSKARAALSEFYLQD